MLIKTDWSNLLNQEFEKEYFKNIFSFLKKQKEEGKIIYPPESDIFNVFNLCSYNKVKVLVIGQDPYFTTGTAHGLAFSTLQDKCPPSLQNIYKEITTDIGDIKHYTNDLTYWVKQGVFLLNTSLTVEKGKPGSHSKIGWQFFTEKVLQLLNDKDKPIVFILWGNHAKQYKHLITNDKHLILEASHPSPFSAYHGFFGCKHFSQCNQFLMKYYGKKIDWSFQKYE